MKQGKSLQELAAELQRQSDAKRDYVADTRAIQVKPIKEVSVQDAAHATIAAMQIGGAGAATKDITKQHQSNAAFLAMTLGDQDYPINNHALRQIGSRLKIPAAYVDRLAQAHPDMLAYNINALFSREPEKRMIRTLDGKARAFMSERYRIMDNFQFAEAILPALMQFGAKVESCEVTENFLHIKAIREDLVAEIPPPPGAVMGQGHTFFVSKVQAGICFRNSEIGAGRLMVSPAVYTKQCTNYAVFTDTSYGKYHLGKALSNGNSADLWEYFSDETKELSDKSVWSQVKDLTEKAMDGTIFKRLVEKLTESREDKLEGSPVKAVELLAKNNNLNQNDQDGILRHLIEGGDLSRFGLHNAITRYSSDVEQYDKATELEQLGGDIIELPKSSWREIAKAA